MDVAPKSDQEIAEALRDWNVEELAERFGDKRTRLICPACDSEAFRKGPEGGNSRNYECERGHQWNVHVFGMEHITERADL